MFKENEILLSFAPPYPFKLNFCTNFVIYKTITFFFCCLIKIAWAATRLLGLIRLRGRFFWFFGRFTGWGWFSLPVGGDQLQISFRHSLGSGARCWLKVRFKGGKAERGVERNMSGRCWNHGIIMSWRAWRRSCWWRGRGSIAIIRIIMWIIMSWRAWRRSCWWRGWRWRNWRGRTSWRGRSWRGRSYSTIGIEFVGTKKIKKKLLDAQIWQQNYTSILNISRKLFYIFTFLLFLVLNVLVNCNVNDLEFVKITFFFNFKIFISFLKWFEKEIKVSWN